MICLKEGWGSELYAKELERCNCRDSRVVGIGLSVLEVKSEVLDFLSWSIRCDRSIEREMRDQRLRGRNETLNRRLTYGLSGSSSGSQDCRDQDSRYEEWRMGMIIDAPTG